MDNSSTITELTRLHKDLEQIAVNSKDIYYGRFTLSQELDNTAAKLGEIIRNMEDDGK